MQSPRAGHTATLLPSGNVLVVGGRTDAAGMPAGAELYNPAANRWSPAGTMAERRLWHTATLLKTGQVLVVGGTADPGQDCLRTAELYDPATNGWRPAAAMASPRCHATASLLPSGKVLVAGGQNAASVLASAELYDPGANSWMPAAAMSTRRAYHTATVLQSGKVLVAGGWNGSLMLGSAVGLQRGQGCLVGRELDGYPAHRAQGRTCWARGRFWWPEGSTRSSPSVRPAPSFTIRSRIGSSRQSRTDPTHSISSASPARRSISSPVCCMMWRIE